MIAKLSRVSATLHITIGMPPFSSLCFPVVLVEGLLERQNESGTVILDGYGSARLDTKVE
jgi:hypothetical protein